MLRWFVVLALAAVASAHVNSDLRAAENVGLGYAGLGYAGLGYGGLGYGGLGYGGLGYGGLGGGLYPGLLSGYLGLGRGISPYGVLNGAPYAGVPALHGYGVTHATVATPEYQYSTEW